MKVLNQFNNCISHRDADTSYINNNYKDLMKKNNVRMRVSIGNCYDNKAEAFST